MVDSTYGRQVAPRLDATVTADRPSLVLGLNTRSDQPFYWHSEDQLGHLHVIGASGHGKTKFLEVMLRQRLVEGSETGGMLVIDPHGTMIKSTLALIAERRLDRYDNIYLLDPGDPAYSFGFNPLQNFKYYDPAVAAEIITDAIMHGYGGDQASMHRTRTLFNELLHALGTLGLTLLEAPLFWNADQPQVLKHLLERLDDEAQAFWASVYARTPNERATYLEPMINRLRPITRAQPLRDIFGQTERSLDLVEAMDQGAKVFLSLRIGPHMSLESSRLLGTLILTEVYFSAFRRRQPSRPFFCIVDECARYLTPHVAHMLDETRKFGVFLTLSHQHLGHLREAGEHIFQSVMANCRARAVFGGLSVADSEELAALMFRGTFNLQQYKPQLLRMQGVGNRKVALNSESQTTSTHRASGTSRSTGSSTQTGTTKTTGTTVTDGTNWSQGGGVVASVARTTSHSRSIGHADTESYATTDGTTEGWSATTVESESTTEVDMHAQSSTSGETYDYDAPFGLLPTSSHDSASSGETDTYGSSTTYTSSSTVSQSGSRSHATTRGSSHTENEQTTEGDASTRGRSRQRTWSKGGSQSTGRSASEARSESASVTTASGTTASSGTSEAATRGQAEAFVTEYAPVPTETWRLEELIHKAAVSIAHLPCGEAWVKIGRKRPRRLAVPFVRDFDVMPQLLSGSVSRIAAKTPWVATRTQAQKEHAQLRADIAAAALAALKRKQQQDDDAADDFKLEFD